MRPTRWLLLAIWAASTIVFSVWNTALMDLGLGERELLYLGEKALLVFHGRPPLLENLGFVFPPLPYAFVLVLRSPLVGAAAIGGVLLCALLVWMRHSPLDGYTRGLALLVAATPPGLWLLTQSPRMALLTGALLASFVWLRRYCATRATLHLFLFGLTSSAIFLAAYEAVVLVPFMVLPLLREPRDMREKAAILTTALMPSAFMVGGWVYLNWIFLGDPWAFLAGWKTALAESAAYPPGLDAGLRHAALFVRTHALALAPWFLATVDVLRRRPGCWPATLALLATPAAWVILQGTLGTPANATVLPLFWACAVVSHGTPDCAACTLGTPRTLLPLSLAVAFFWTWGTSLVDDTQPLYRALHGLPAPSTWSSTQNLVATLRAEAGTVLLDDTRLFPVVYLEGRPQRFLFPYEYEFEGAIRTPALFARFVVVDSSGDDRITRQHPLARIGMLQGYFLRARYGHLLLYERQRSTAPLPALFSPPNR
jgi:hypothetical protein